MPYEPAAQPDNINGDRHTRQPSTSVPTQAIQDRDSRLRMAGSRDSTLFVTVLQNCDPDRNLYLRWLGVQLRLQVPAGLRIAKSVAKIIQMLHADGMAILPIKPSLFELMPNGDVKLIDMSRGLFDLNARHKNTSKKAREMIVPSGDENMFEFDNIDYFIKDINSRSDGRSKKRVINPN